MLHNRTEDASFNGYEVRQRVTQAKSSDKEIDGERESVCVCVCVRACVRACESARTRERESSLACSHGLHQPH